WTWDSVLIATSSTALVRRPARQPAVFGGSDPRNCRDPSLARRKRRAVCSFSSVKNRRRLPRRSNRASGVSRPAAQVGGAHVRAACATYAARSRICLSVRRFWYDGITALPLLTTSLTRWASGCSRSRSGPTLPFARAARRVWHAPQPADAKTALPAAAEPGATAAGDVTPACE